MRNLMEYPITPNEVVDCLLQLAAGFAGEERYGDMRPLLLREAALAVTARELMRPVLKECADDLAVYIDHHYEKTLDYPSQKLKYDNEMVLVQQARKLLGE